MHYNKYLKVSHQALTSKGVYNGYVDKDSLLHVDPLLLKTCSIPEFQNAYKEFLSYFKSFVLLVKRVKYPNSSDRFFRQILRLFNFSEIPNTGLGYSTGTTKGNGISGALSTQLAMSAYEIISAGLEEPEIFGLMQLIEDNIGPDRISDMTIAILQKNFLSYTQRVAAELNIKTKIYNYQETTYKVPFYNGRPIHFIPMSILADLPIAHNFDEIDDVCNYNTELKKRVAKVIGLTWQEYKNYKKQDWRNLILTNPDCYKSAISFYKGLTGISYDFEKDDKEQYLDIMREEFLSRFPFNYSFSQNTNIDKEVYNFTMSMCRQFKHLVEDNRLSEIFYRKGRQPDETDWQMMLYTVAETYRTAGNFDITITREDNPGVGEIDFHISRGAKANTIIEIKRSGNKDLYHGYRSQLAAYVRAERATSAIFMVIIEDNNYESINNQLLSIQDDMRKNGEYVPEIIYVNGQKQFSASNPKYTSPEL